jgi:siroheme synthase
VALVGTGPGDPELLTLKAIRAIEAADLVLYDRLVSNDVLDLVGEGARLLYVGKTAGYHSRTQVRNTVPLIQLRLNEVYTLYEMLIGRAFCN